LQKINVLDHGYVRLADSMGTDLSIVNAARVSYDKESAEFNDKDERLINFLWKHNHTAPFRHAVITFEVYAPLMIARQWFKYSVASAHLDSQQGWNESSRRYVTEEPTFYIPAQDEWREAPANSKQGSGEQVDPRIGKILTEELDRSIREAISNYDRLMEMGVCAEQARLFLPAYGMYVRWRWTTSLSGVLHLLDERLEHDAQFEFQQFAQAVRDLVQPLFPSTFKAVFNG
jgi:thymidylate synthase (FAD)